jgi:AcrR family transcriptional regulator
VTGAERELLRPETIVGRAVEIVDAGGPEALSLRSLGRDLGVSAPALYDHISSKDDLLRLVAGVGYAELADRWSRIEPGDAEAWIRASSHAYVAFALERPGLFALMFRYRPAFIEGPREVEDPAATAVFAQALVIVERAVDDGLLGGSPPLELALGLWAAIHGVATVLSMSPEMTKELWLVDLVIDGLLAGWKEPTP